jgi:hypothetical protein
MKRVYKFILLIFAITIISCNDDEKTDPSIETSDSNATSATTFIASGTIKAIGSYKIKDYGFEYYTYDQSSAIKISMGSTPQPGHFEKEISVELTYGYSNVFVRAYIENEIGIVYGESKQVSFPTLAVTGISATTAKAGDHINITGANFSTNKNDDIVLFGNQPANIISATSTQLVVEVPSVDVSYSYYGVSVVLKVGNQQVTVTNYFQFLPSVTSFSPQSGGVGTYVTILGTNFNTNSGYTIMVNNSTTSGYSSNTTALGFNIPNGVTSDKLKISIVLNGTTIELPGEFTITPPEVNGLNQNSGIIGSLITVSGANLTNDTGTYASPEIKVGGISASIQSITSSEIKFYVPQGLSTGSYNVTMKTPIRELTITDQFTLTSPTIDSFSPSSGVPYSYVTITGKNLGSSYYGSSVSLGANQASIYSWTDTSITFVVPYYMSAGSYTITVNTGGQSVTTTDTFTVISN